jgi:hypothetical protein
MSDTSKSAGPARKGTVSRRTALKKGERRRRGLLHVLLSTGLVSGAIAPLTHVASAQVLYGTLTGTVTDNTGAVIPNANVTAREASTGVERTARANSAGVYLFSDLNPGTYQLTISAPGFSSFKQDNIGVLTNTSERVNAALSPGSTQEITVTTAPPMLQTETAQTDYNLGPEMVSELPTTSSTGRNFQSLYRLVPGSTPPAEQNSPGSNPQRAQAVNVNGVSNATNTTRIDGAVDAYPWLPYLVAYLPPTDGIDSINVVTGSFNAEQGAAGGSAINVTIKSGTNHLHGSVWEFNSISQFNAQAWQNRTGVRQKNIYNEVGGSVGGPVIKDKLFFFFDYNRVSVNRAINGTLSVPTLDMRNGIFAATGTTIYDPATGSSTGAGKTAFSGDQVPAGRIAPAAQILLQNLPAPNTGAPGQLANNYFGAATNAFLRQNYDAKITYVPTQSTSFFGHYSASPDTISDPQVFGSNPGGGTYDGGQPGLSTGLIQNVGLGFTHAFTPHLSTDWNAGYTRQRVGAQAGDIALGDYGVNTLKIPGTNYGGIPLYAGIPGFYFTTYSNLGNANSGNPFNFRDNQYTGNANATWVKGLHTIRFGGEYLHAAINHIQPGSGSQATDRGSFVFSGGATTNGGGTATAVNSFADFLLGQADNYQKSIQSFNPEPLRYSTFSFYAQDTWEATPKLTLNYGLRYEYYPLPVGDHFGTVRFDPSVFSTLNGNRVGTVLVGGKNGIPYHANTSNGWGMIVPRFGASYRATDKTVIRTGFGLTVDPDTLRDLLQAYPAGIVANVSGVNSYEPVTSLNAGLQSPVSLVGIPTLAIPDINQGYLALPNNLSTYSIPQNFRRGYIESYNLSIQQQLPASFTTTVAYVGTHSVRQQTSVNNNAAPPGGGNAGRLLNTTYGGPNGNFNNADQTLLLPFRGSVYNGLQAQLTRMSARHISTGVVYTFSKAMDISDNSEASGLTFAYPSYWNRNWALAGYDRKHNLQWWTIYNVPFGKGQKYLNTGLLGYIVGNWRLSPILSYVSGTPFTVTDAGTFLNAPGNTQVADQLPGVSTVVGGRNYAGSGFQYLNPSAFRSVNASTAAAPRFGTAGRNSVRGPGAFDLDASLKRSFPIHESIALDLSAESFDVTNTPQFANPGTTGFNAATSTPSVPQSGFGVITSSNVNRTLRFSARISF